MVRYSGLIVDVGDALKSRYKCTYAFLLTCCTGHSCLHVCAHMCPLSHFKHSTWCLHFVEAAVQMSCHNAVPFALLLQFNELSNTLLVSDFKFKVGVSMLKFNACVCNVQAISQQKFQLQC